MRFLNLTASAANQHQLSVGVIDIPDDDRQVIANLLDLKTLPDLEEQEAIIQTIVDIGIKWYKELDCDTAMIGGHMFMLPPLADALNAAGLNVIRKFKVDLLSNI